MISGSGPGSQSQVPDFDGMTVAAKCLARLCEQGNLTVAAELIQAKADLNMPEPEIGVTPLIAAANAGHLDVCKYLMLGQHKKRESHGDSVLIMLISPTIYYQPATLFKWVYQS